MRDTDHPFVLYGVFAATGIGFCQLQYNENNPEQEQPCKTSLHLMTHRQTNTLGTVHEHM